MDEFEEQNKTLTPKKTTMKDVAKHAGVSISTVSHVINGTRFVSPEVGKRVEHACRVLKYKPNLIAQNLRSGRSGNIGFVVPNLENSFYVRVAKGIEKAINAFGYKLFLIDSCENKEKEISNVESLYMRGIDGLILVPTTPDCGYLSSIVQDSNFPIVFLDRYPMNWEADCVLLDNEEAAYQATNLFISKGIKNIAFIAIQFGEEKEIDDIIKERIAGYKKALSEANIPYRKDFVKTATSPPLPTSELGYSEAFKLTEELLESDIQAIISGNNHSSIGVYSCLKKFDIVMPKHISLLTFDDDFWHQMTIPSISAIQQPEATIGKIAAKRLILRLTMDQELSFERFRLKAKIIHRESSL